MTTESLSFITFLRVVVVVSCWVVAIVCGLMNVQAVDRIVREVNAKLPHEQRFSSYGWYYAKWRRLVSEYRRMYPSGTQVERCRRLSVLMLVDVVVAAVVLGAGLDGALLLGAAGSLSLWFGFRR